MVIYLDPELSPRKDDIYGCFRLRSWLFHFNLRILVPPSCSVHDTFCQGMYEGTYNFFCCPLERFADPLRNLIRPCDSSLLS
jgi:hypothetical protein